VLATENKGGLWWFVVAWLSRVRRPLDPVPLSLWRCGSCQKCGLTKKVLLPITKDFLLKHLLRF